MISKGVSRADFGTRQLLRADCKWLRRMASFACNENGQVHKLSSLLSAKCSGAQRKRSVARRSIRKWPDWQSGRDRRRVVAGLAARQSGRATSCVGVVAVRHRLSY